MEYRKGKEGYGVYAAPPPHFEFKWQVKIRKRTVNNNGKVHR